MLLSEEAIQGAQPCAGGSPDFSCSTFILWTEIGKCYLICLVIGISFNCFFKNSSLNTTVLFYFSLFFYLYYLPLVAKQVLFQIKAET